MYYKVVNKLGIYLVLFLQTSKSTNTIYMFFLISKVCASVGLFFVIVVCCKLPSVGCRVWDADLIVSCLSVVHYLSLLLFNVVCFRLSCVGCWGVGC